MPTVAEQAVADHLKGDQKPVIPEFFTEAVMLGFRSEQEGKPVYEERQFVRIHIPGSRSSAHVEPLNDEHKARWPSEYEAFQKGLEAPLTGTPLTEWPNSRLNKARVMELAYYNIRTVEELASVHDNNLGNLGMGSRELREAARKFLEVARTGTGPLEKMLSEIDRLKSENERKDQLIQEFGARLAALEKQKDKTDARTAA